VKNNKAKGKNALSKRAPYEAYRFRQAINEDILRKFEALADEKVSRNEAQRRHEEVIIAGLIAMAPKRLRLWVKLCLDSQLFSRGFASYALLCSSPRGPFGNFKEARKEVHLLARAWRGCVRVRCSSGRRVELTDRLIVELDFPA